MDVKKTETKIIYRGRGSYSQETALRELEAKRRAAALETLTSGASGSKGSTGSPCPSSSRVGGGRGQLIAKVREIQEQAAREVRDDAARAAEAAQRATTAWEVAEAAGGAEHVGSDSDKQIADPAGILGEGLHESPVAPEDILQRLEAIHLHSPEEPEEVEIDKKGDFGNRINVSTNYVYLKTDPMKNVFEYEVHFVPEVDYVSFRFRILYEHFGSEKDMLCYDGSMRLYTPVKITGTSVQFKSCHPTTGEEVYLIIKYKREAKAKDCAVLYNTLLKSCARVMGLSRFRNKFYDHSCSFQIPQHKLEIWPGYVTSVDEFDGGIQLRCDVHHRVLRTDTALEYLTRLIMSHPENYKEFVERELLGQCVLTKYNNNLYRIDDIDWTKSPLDTFKLNTGRDITFMDYYKNQYNIDIGDTKQPLLVNRTKDEKGMKSRLICLVPELCLMTGLTDHMKTDIKVMKDIAVYTRITPAQRVLGFKRFLENMKGNELAKAMLEKWGLTITEEPVTLTARNLGSELLFFGHRQKISSGNGDWQKCFRDVTVFQSVDIVNWVILYPKRDNRLSNVFVNIIKQSGPGMGIMVNEPKLVKLLDDRISTYMTALRENVNDKVQIVVCICPTGREDRYAAIKKFCCNEKPVPSQVINAVTLAREDRVRSVVQNIALQMNNKLGGASWAVRVPFKMTMVCGVDTYHDKYNSGFSVGGFVASSNQDFTQWFSRVSIQGPKEELVTGLAHCFEAALEHFREKNQTFPERIVVYRDGIGEGQFETCKDYEVSQFLDVCRRLGKDYRPLFSYFVVQKRISTKFYEISDDNLGNIQSPSPGGVVDNTITRRHLYDFYLVSQLVRVGTATPTHYIVLYDNSNLKPDHAQRLTYKFCHLYYNWSGTIRIPAPCGYAHKLAYLVGQNVKTVPSKKLEDKLYYL